MTTNREKVTSCWTCRLRRKECDNALPVCSACDTLEINCFQETNRPEWMDNGSRQREMTQRIQAPTHGQMSSRFHDAAHPTHRIPPRVSLATDYSSTIPTTSPHKMHHHETYLLPDTLETIFVMAYLDYVFPISFPFYRPKILDGGRSWLLNSILKNKCLRHTIISLTSYFFSVVKVNPESAHQICEAYTWVRVLALKKAQLDLHEFSHNGNILEKANLMESIVQLLTVEVMLGSTENWQMHLDAAGMLFQQLLRSHSNDDDPRSAFSQILRQIGSHSPLRTPPTGPMWDPDQAAFRFFSAILIFDDIIASTSPSKPPDSASTTPISSEMACTQPQNHPHN